MVARSYLTRQALTLLKMARVARDSAVATALITKAADIEGRLAEDARLDELRQAKGDGSSSEPQ
jgi:hypothetical protein